jgi:hypothetical protein
MSTAGDVRPTRRGATTGNERSGDARARLPFIDHPSPHIPSPRRAYKHKKRRPGTVAVLAVVAETGDPISIYGRFYTESDCPNEKP